MISTLRMGKTGTQILEILDAITSDSQTKVMQTVQAVGDTISQGVSINKGTLDPIEFWSVCATCFSGTNIYHSALNRVLYTQLSNSFH